MARIKFVSKGLSELIGEKEAKAFENSYKELINKISPLLDNVDFEVVVRATIRKDQFEIYAVTDNFEFEMQRIFTKKSGEWTLENALLVIDEKFQSKGIADSVNLVGAQQLENLGGKIVEVHANIDVGGYAWLRKGFWPVNGKEFIINRLRRTADLDRFLKMTEAELKAFVLTEDFRKYKTAFLNSNWFGSLDITDATAYEKFTGVKKQTSKHTQPKRSKPTNNQRAILSAKFKDQIEAVMASTGSNLQDLGTLLLRGSPQIQKVAEGRLAFLVSTRQANKEEGGAFLRLAGKWDATSSELLESFNLLKDKYTLTDKTNPISEYLQEILAQAVDGNAPNFKVPEEVLSAIRESYVTEQPKPKPKAKVQVKPKAVEVGQPVKTANQEIHDALIRHQTYLLRYSGSVRNKIIEVLNATEEAIAEKIRAKLTNHKGFNNASDWARLQSLMETLSGIRGKAWDEANEYWYKESLQLAYQEPIMLEGVIVANLPVTVNTVMPGPNLLKHIVTSRPFQGRVLKEWAEAMKDDDLRRIKTAIQVGMVSGESSDNIARRVVGTGVFNGQDGVTQLSRVQVQSITRTAVQHIANDARREFLKSNSDIISEDLFVATLDSRTTPQCKANDGNTYEVGKGPQPPLHFGCRSLRVGIIDDNVIGDRPFKASTEKQLIREWSEQNGLSGVKSREDLPRGTKGNYDTFARRRVREMTGQVPAKTSYNEWLKRQTLEFQEDTLGKAKAQLFRKGGLSLDKFVARDGSELTLKEIAKRHTDAFEKAGLDPNKYI